MISPVTLRPRARLDLLEQFVYFGEQSGVQLAERYLAAVDATCLNVADHPHSGVSYDFGVARLGSMGNDGKHLRAADEPLMAGRTGHPER